MSWYMYVWECQGVVGLYISLGVGGLYVAYPYGGAMRRPEYRDRRGEKLYSHVFFCSLFIRDDSIFRMLMRVTTSKGRSWPGAGFCPLQTMMDFSSH